MVLKFHLLIVLLEREKIAQSKCDMKEVGVLFVTHLQ